MRAADTLKVFALAMLLPPRAVAQNPPRRPPPRATAAAPTRSPAAAAPPASPAASNGGNRRQLIDDARRLSMSGNHNQAVRVLLEVARTAGGMTPSLRMAITDEYRAMAGWRETFFNARLCVQETSAAPRDLQNRAFILGHCRTLLQEAVEHVGRVVFVLPDNAPLDTVITVGEAIGRDQWTGSAAVTPGPVGVTVNASGYRAVTRELTATDGQTVQTRIELEPERLPAAEPGSTASAPPPPTTPSVPGPAQPAMDRARSMVVQGSGAGPWVLIATGVALGAAGAVTSVLLRQRAESDLGEVQAAAHSNRDDCGNRLACDRLDQTYAQNARGPRDTIDTMNVLLGASIGVAATAAVGGLVWLLVRPRLEAPQPRAVAFGLQMSATGATLQAGGTF